MAEAVIRERRDHLKLILMKPGCINLAGDFSKEQFKSDMNNQKNS